MFICHKCGYKDMSETNKTNCPVCGTNITVPKFGMILFFALVSFILSCFLSAFNNKLSFMQSLSFIFVVFALPFAIGEAYERGHEIKDGFRTPNSPNEIINGDNRVPNFKSYDYVYGITPDKGIKKIMLEPYKDGLNYFYNTLSKTEKLDYSDITELILHKENKNRYVLEIKTKGNNDIKNLYITADKNELLNLINDIKMFLYDI